MIKWYDTKETSKNMVKKINAHQLTAIVISIVSIAAVAAVMTVTI